MAKVLQEDRDYFTDLSVLRDPYAYFERLRADGPVHQMPSRPDVVIVTGFEEALAVLRNTDDFSSVASTNPIGAFPFTPEGDDITDQLEAHRKEISPMGLLVTYDGDQHLAARSLLNSLFTPSRLRANGEFMWRYAEELVKEAVAAGECELVGKIATPYVTLVIADLLGVPEDDREAFRKVLDSGPPPGDMEGSPNGATVSHPLEFMASYFARYIQERRTNPQNDVMSEMGAAKFPDGSTPDLMEVVKAAMFLFAAGQDTSAKLLGNSMRRIAEDQDLQQRLRADRSLIAPFLEEVLRLEGSTKATFRVARRRTRIGDMDIPAGKRIVIAFAAANRDARRWEDPAEFRIGRPRIKEHVAFGRGAHVCIGAPLARVEVRVLVDLFLGATTRITLSEAHHGPAEDRDLRYEPSYIIRGLENLNLLLER